MSNKGAHHRSCLNIGKFSPQNTITHISHIVKDMTKLWVMSCPEKKVFLSSFCFERGQKERSRPFLLLKRNVTEARFSPEQPLWVAGLQSYDVPNSCWNICSEIDTN